MSDHNKYESYPLSPIQQGMLFHSLINTGPGVDILQYISDIHEPLNIEAFQYALDRVVDRHAVLRSKFEWKDISEPRQVVMPQVVLKVECIDLKQLSKGEQEEKLEVYIQTDRGKGIDISHAPLMRIAILMLDEAEYKIVWTIHHIIIEGPLAFEEVMTYYDAYIEHHNLEIPYPRPYKDYVSWVRARDLTKDEKFWREQLAGVSAPTSLVVGACPDSQSKLMGSQGILESRLSAFLTSTLRQLASINGLSMNTLFEGAWALLLARYNDEEDILYGTTRSCRRAFEGADSMIGLLINTVPMRVKINKKMKMIDWLKILRQKHVQLREYIHSPLYEIQRWSDIAHGNPLFESIVVFDNETMTSYIQRKGGKWLKRDLEFRGQTNFPLTILGYDDQEMLLRIRYDRAYFTQDAVERILGHLQTILQSIPGNLDTCVAEMPILTEHESRQLIEEWNDTKRDYPTDKTIHDLFEEQVARTPDALALSYESQSLTYREFNEKANRLAHYLKKLGVGPDVPVGICMERSLDLMIGLLGILKAGGAYVPMDPDFPAERIAYLAEDAGVPVILAQQHLAGTMPEIQARIICLDAPEYSQSLAGMPVNNPQKSATAENLVYVIYTSGSTGKPKGVAIEHRHLVNYVQGICERMAFEPGWNYATVSTIAADLGNTVVFPSWCTGGCLHVISKARISDPEALAEYFDRQQIDCLKIVPSHMAALLTGQNPQKLMPRRRLILGGEASRRDWIENLRTLAQGCTIYNHYGPTETTVGVLTCAVGDDLQQTASGTLALGRPLPNTQVYILDGQRQPVPINVPGELYISGDGVARGYWNRPALTTEKFISNPFCNASGVRMYRTGDRTRYLSDGNIEFLERVDQQVKIRGFRIELGEIESVLVQHGAVQEIKVLAREDVPGDKRLVAYIVPAGSSAPSANELRSHLKGKLPDYMVPVAFVMIEKIPLTANGKLDTRALPLPEYARPELEEKYVAPRNAIEQTLAKMWSELLNVKRVGINDNFFELGGHSLLALRLFVRIRKSTGIDLPLATLFKTPTIRALAKLLDPESAATPVSGEIVSEVSSPIRHWRSLVPIQPQGNRLPLFLMHAGGGNVLNYLPLLPHLGPDQPVYGLQARGLDGLLSPHSSMEEMARHYITEIRTVQPSGPYYLGGASFGGTCAFEIARQLTDQGEKVALLALFDTIGPGKQGYRQWRTSLTGRLSRQYEKNTQIPLPLYIMKRINRYLSNKVRDLRIRYFSLMKHPIPLELRERYLMINHHKAITSYTPRPYRGSVTLFRGPAGNEWPYNDPRLGWEDILNGDFKIIIIDAHHLDFMEPPELGIKFAEALRLAQEKDQYSGPKSGGIPKIESAGSDKSAYA